MSLLKNYLGSLSYSKTVLWCYLIWYVVIVAFYFDSRVSLWLNSLGISVIVGIAINLSAGSLTRQHIQQKPWEVTRLFLSPFCVASFSALIKGHGFLLILAPQLWINLVAMLCCVLFFVVVIVLKRSIKEVSIQQEDN